MGDISYPIIDCVTEDAVTASTYIYFRRITHNKDSFVVEKPMGGPEHGWVVTVSTDEYSINIQWIVRGNRLHPRVLSVDTWY